MVGVAGGLLVSVSLFPQIWKTYQTRNTKDISFKYQLIYAIGLGGIILYGLYFKLWPIYIPTIVELVSLLILTFLKLRFEGLGNVRESTLSRLI